MSRSPKAVIGLAAAALLAAVPQLDAQQTNPFRPDYGWGELPDGREWGSTSTVYPAPGGTQMWIAERCGSNNCVGSDVDPVMLFDLDGTMVRSFGAGLLAWPHGIFVDDAGNVWIADGTRGGADEAGIGHAVLKFSPMGELLMTIGTPGEEGEPPTHLNQPTDVLVAPDGDIFIAQSHGHDTPGHSILKFASDGTFLEEIGEPGYGPLQFREPHALAMDSQGRIFIGDRYNNRIQIMDQEGNFIASWTQFGRPSGIYIDANDVMYVADSESAPDDGNPYTGQRNAGWMKGIRIGSAATGWVHHFLPDDDPDAGGFSGPEGVAVDADGNVYGAEVSQGRITKWVRFGP